MNSLRIELLLNGYYRIFDYASKLSGLYNGDGTYHSGDLQLPASVVKVLIVNCEVELI